MQVRENLHAPFEHLEQAIVRPFDGDRKGLVGGGGVAGGACTTPRLVARKINVGSMDRDKYSALSPFAQINAAA
jgi:hypothetical protein